MIHTINEEAIEELSNAVRRVTLGGFVRMMWYGNFGPKRYLKLNGKKLWLHRKSRTRKHRNG